MELDSTQRLGCDASGTATKRHCIDTEGINATTC